MKWGTGQEKLSKMEGKKYRKGGKGHSGYIEKVLPIWLDFYKERERMGKK